MTRRKFTSNFKLNAIKLGEEKQNVAQAARELGIKASLIHRWKREQEEFGSVALIIFRPFFIKFLECSKS